MLPPLTSFKKAALDLLFPPYCISCGREGNYICGICSRDLPFISPPVCPICGRPLLPDDTCPGCISKQRDIEGIRAPFLFEGVIRHAVHQLKYNNFRAIAPLLALFLYDFLQQNPLPGSVLVPVPVHKKRFRERGYNQSALLAQELGRLSGMPVIEDCLIKHAYTPPQARAASALDRLKNISGAFACKDSRLKEQQVILIDDVSTSGATMNACAGTLKAAGAAAVWGLVLALEL